MRTILACLATTLALATASAQDNLDPRLRLAELAEKSEHDLPRAIAILREVYADVTMPAAARVDIGRRVVDLLRRAGQTTEAEAFARALAEFAASNGVEKLDVGGAQRNPDLAREIDVLIEVVTNQGSPTASTRLAWIGERALGQIEKACRKENQISRLTNLLAVVVAIGGERAEAILSRVCRDEDPLRRRAVALAYKTAREIPELGARIRVAAIGVLAADRNPEVRADAIRMRVFGDFDAYLANLRDSDRRIRTAVLESGTPSAAEFAEDVTAKPERFLEAARLIAADPELGVLGQGHGSSDWMIDAPLLVRLQCWLELASALYGANAPGGIGLPADALGEELCRAVERARSHSIPSSNLGHLRQAAQQITSSWTAKSLPHWLRLAEAGVIGDPEVFERHATPADRQRLLTKVDIFAMVTNQDGSVADRVARAALGDLPEESFATLRAILTRILEAPRDTELHRRASGWVYGIMRRMASFEHPAAVAWSEATIHDPAGAGLVDGSYQPVPGGKAPKAVWDVLETSDKAPHRQLRNRLLVHEGDDYAALRSYAFSTALRFEDRDALALFPRAYELGLGGTSTPRGIGVLAVFRTVGVDFALDALDACLASGQPAAWEDAKSILHWFGQTFPSRSIVPVLLRHVSRVEPAKERAHWFDRIADQCHFRPRDPDVALLSTVFQAWLRDPSPEVVADGLSQLRRLATPWPAPIRELVESLATSETSDVRYRASRWLCDVPPGVSTEQLLRWLQGDDRPMADLAAGELLHADPNAALDHLLPLLEKGKIASSFGHTLATRTMDTRLVPILLRDLRSGREDLRAAARAALDAIEYYTQQERRWQKLVEAGGLEAKDPAEALLRQAREATGELRLLAIDSLGTLAKPEVLPFLIDMLGSEADDAAKSRLRAAIARINAQR